MYQLQIITLKGKVKWQLHILHERLDELGPACWLQLSHNSSDYFNSDPGEEIHTSLFFTSGCVALNLVWVND